MNAHLSVPWLSLFIFGEERRRRGRGSWRQSGFGLEGEDEGTSDSVPNEKDSLREV